MPVLFCPDPGDHFAEAPVCPEEIGHGNALKGRPLRQAVPVKGVFPALRAALGALEAHGNDPAEQLAWFFLQGRRNGNGATEGGWDYGDSAW